MDKFDWPWEYSFPPFFTLQPHAKTRKQQITSWITLIIKYYKHNKLSLIDINEDNELFSNSTINRKLPSDARTTILEEMLKTGHSNPIDKRKLQWEIYWHTLDEFANIIYNWSIETGQTNTVCTIYEIANGDGSIDQVFYQLDQNIIIKALQILENKGRCEIINLDDDKGVKFF